MYRGSRKHVLDWTARPSFLAELEEVLAPIPIFTSADTVFMGRGGRCPIHSFYFSLFSFLIPAENAPKQTQDLVQNPLTPNSLFCIFNPAPSEFLSISGLSRGQSKIHETWKGRADD
jgi:hypothetical protein